MQPTKLTEAFISQLAYEDKPVVVRDTIVKGLMVAVNKHSKCYKVQRDLSVGQRGRRRKGLVDYIVSNYAGSAPAANWLSEC